VHASYGFLVVVMTDLFLLVFVVRQDFPEVLEPNFSVFTRIGNFPEDVLVSFLNFA